LPLKANQLQFAKQISMGIGCSTFVLLLMISLFCKGMPSLEMLLLIVLGSLGVGWMGFYLGCVFIGPMHAKVDRKAISRGANQAVDHPTVDASQASTATVDLPAPEQPNESTTEQAKTGNQLDEIQTGVPVAEDGNQSEHDWVDTNQSTAAPEIIFNKTKAEA
jgi:hypothetical protein